MDGVIDDKKTDLLGEILDLELVRNQSNEAIAAVSNKDSFKENTVPVKQTVIRLKRRIEDSPSKILVVSYKRTKTDLDKSVPGAGDGSEAKTTSVEDDPVCSQILRLVGTVTEDESDKNNIAATVRNVIGTGGSTAVAASSSSGDARLPFRKCIKAKTSNITEKSREKFKRNTEENRFKIVTSRRGVSDEQANNQQCETEIDLLKLLDLVPENESEGPKKKVRPEGFEPGNVTCNGLPMIKDVAADEKGFVYDLYLSNDPCIEEFMCGQFLSVEEGDGDSEFADYREKGEDDEDFMEGDDDSNAEDNWRNDYPDSEDDGLRETRFVYEAAGGDSDEDVGTNFKGLHLKGDSSSDDDVIYGIEDDNDGMGFDQKYSRYKRRVMDEYEDEVVSASDSDFD